ncbi:crosslink repair DNA glycosylase YcaQ family protein [Streptococcus ruminantium]|nr:crosslink repair DNA glycosylase YcaQ family protein [Streptococcus ruminantium]MDQ8766501.1 crosslink repair DNA glycosylase YcaQ family protein [Streptococcus ruminantium]MDQ8779931.1 crosslink repair DNA glycosylase YcaQ family protein [Streptococcus ruminantium]
MYKPPFFTGGYDSASFDQLLLGYEKKANPFFDLSYIRKIYTLTGIIKPTVFYKGRLVATWR